MPFLFTYTSTLRPDWGLAVGHVFVTFCQGAFTGSLAFPDDDRGLVRDAGYGLIRARHLHGLTAFV